MDLQINDISLNDFSVSMLTRRKIDRVLSRNTAGEDIIDHGRSSFEFEIRGRIEIEKYMSLLKLIEAGNIRFVSDFGEFHVVAKEVLYNDDGRLYLKLVEDIRPDD